MLPAVRMQDGAGFSFLEVLDGMKGFFFFYFEAFLPNDFLIERSGKTLRQADCGF